MSEMSWRTNVKNGRIIEDAAGNKIATAERQSDAPKAWKHANLIAAAPDLLAACEAVLPWVALATNEYDPDRHPKSIQNAKDDLAQLMEAIAKAKGTPHA